MILDTLDNFHQYVTLRPGFETAWEFMKNTDLANLSEGKHIIDGDRVFASVMLAPGRGQAAVQLEAHDRYIDIQCIMTGPDIIGWRDRKDCKSVAMPYDSERDLMFYNEPPASWISCPAGSFALLMPWDAHAPMAGDGMVRKVIFKVQV